MFGKLLGREEDGPVKSLSIVRRNLGLRPLGAVMGTVEVGMPVIPTLIRSVRSLEKEGLRAAGTFKPPLPEGALPGLAV